MPVQPRIPTQTSAKTTTKTTTQGPSPTAPSPPTFLDLCQGFCDRLGARCPPLQSSDAPVPGLRMAVGDVEVELLQAAAQEPHWGLLLVHLGEMPDFHEAQAHLTLLQANFMLMGPSPAVFAVHPVSGSAILYQSFHVASVTSERLELAARELIGIALRWRRGEFLAPKGNTQDRPPEPSGMHPVHRA